MPLRLSDDEWYFLIRWILANTIGWSLGLILAIGLLAVGFVLNVVLPDWLIVALIPIAGGIVGASVGLAQRWALENNRQWVWSSAAGGAIATIPAMGLGLLLRFDPLIARLVIGAVLAAGISAAQLVTQGISDNRWTAIRRWAVMNAIAGFLCAGLSPAGAHLWLPLTCLLGTGLFGAVTGAALIRVGRE